MPLTDWMKAYGSRTLGEMHLPGSHDAGTSKGYIDLTKAGTVSNSATQDKTIPEQINAGTRFFDLRLAEHKKRIVAHHTTAGQGAYSNVGVDQVLSDAADFCEHHQDEVVIFRISHTSGSTKADDIAVASAKKALHTGTGNLCLKKLSDIVRDGNLVLIFDDEKFTIDQKKGIHGYSKFTATPNAAGIATCGCYSQTHKLEDVICNGLKGQYEHNVSHAKSHDHLWQVYWQKTYVNPTSGTGIERGAKKAAQFKKGVKTSGGTHAATGYMISLMKGLGNPLGTPNYEVQSEKKKGVVKKKVVRQKVMYSTLAFRDFALPNILSYDFVNEDINKLIIRMNDKSLQKVRDDNLEDSDDDSASDSDDDSEF